MPPLAPMGVYSGTRTIGGLIERGDIHRAVLDHPDMLADMAPATLNPDDLADTLWRMYTNRTDPEVIVNAL